LIPEFVTQDRERDATPPRAGRGAAADLLRRGQLAARRGETVRAVRLLRAALIADSSNLDARLWLAAIAEDPEESLQILTGVLHEHPGHPRALAGLRWACERLDDRARPGQEVQPPACPQVQALPGPPLRPPAAIRVILALLCLLGVMGVAVVAGQIWVQAERPLPGFLAAFPPSGLGFDEASGAPSHDTPVPGAGHTPALATAAESPEVTSLPSVTPLPTPIVPTATPVPTEVAPTATPAPTEAPATPTPDPTAAPDEDLPAVEGGHEGKWIEVILSEQALIVWEGQTAVRRMIVSTGSAWTPTVTGTFRVYLKVRSQTMTGPGYTLPRVPHVLFFYGDYAIHGTYWHDSFGTPVSRGCVNLTLADAEWLFSWAGPHLPAGQWSVQASESNPGTLVVVRW
jgi:lipoprotein-anchoring transpeptidase ErfK/SrfK